jgi:tetratricopeptide (TPR) repeat protein
MKCSYARKQSLSNTTNNNIIFPCTGRIRHAQGHYQEAVQYLQQGLQLADQVQRPEDEAKIRHRLGLALWGQGDLQAAQTQLYGAIDLFESMRREAQFNSEYKLSLFDLQTASYQALQVRSITQPIHSKTCDKR